MTHFDFVSLANARCKIIVDANVLLNFMLKAKDLASKAMNNALIEAHEYYEVDNLTNKVIASCIVTSCKGTT